MCAAAEGIAVACVVLLVAGHVRFGDAVAVVQQATLPLGGLPALLIVFMGVWPLGIGIALPLAVQLFPTGRPLSPRWRWLIWLTVVSGLAFDAQTVLDPAALALTDRPVAPVVAPATFHAADPLWAVAGATLAVAALVQPARRRMEPGSVSRWLRARPTRQSVS
jgi:hypothetical protein